MNAMPDESIGNPLSASSGRMVPPQRDHQPGVPLFAQRTFRQRKPVLSAKRDPAKAVRLGSWEVAKRPWNQNPAGRFERIQGLAQFPLSWLRRSLKGMHHVLGVEARQSASDRDHRSEQWNW